MDLIFLSDLKDKEYSTALLMIDIFTKYGKIKSRVSFFLIFILGFLPLKDLIKKDKPEYLLIHLITLIGSVGIMLIISLIFLTRFFF